MKALTMIALMLGLTAVAACNTFEGVGQDVQSGGKAIEQSADSVQKKF